MNTMQDNIQDRRHFETDAELVERRTRLRKASIEKTKAERLARRQRYRAVCFFNPAKRTMKEEPSWS